MADQIEQPKEPNLNPAQEAELRGLMPDFEPKGDDIKKEGGGTAQKAPNAETLQIVSVMLAGVFTVAAARLGDHWALLQEELVALAVPTFAVLEKYLPVAKVGPEVALLAAVAMIVFPRVMITLQQQPIEGKSEEVVTDGDKPEHKPQ